MRRIVVTADDVALHPSFTAGALEAHRRGIVTACSVVATGPALEDAAAALRACPTLAVGAHLTLVGTAPLSPSASIPSLCGADGRLLLGFAPFVARYLRGGVILAEVERELRAQLQRLADVGLTPSHLNSHQHLHALPGIAELTIRLAIGLGIGWVRAPRDHPLRWCPPGRALAVAALAVLAARARRRFPDHIQGGRGTLGIAAAGGLETASLVRLLDHADDGFELVCHPGSDDETAGAALEWGYGWEGELRALCAPEAKTAIARRGLMLASPTDFRVAPR